MTSEARPWWHRRLSGRKYWTFYLLTLALLVLSIVLPDEFRWFQSLVVICLLVFVAIDLARRYRRKNGVDRDFC